jgi:hypothetical protein
MHRDPRSWHKLLLFIVPLLILILIPSGVLSLRTPQHFVQKFAVPSLPDDFPGQKHTARYGVHTCRHLSSFQVSKKTTGQSRLHRVHSDRPAPLPISRAYRMSRVSPDACCHVYSTFPILNHLAAKEDLITALQQGAHETRSSVSLV